MSLVRNDQLFTYSDQRNDSCFEFMPIISFYIYI